MRTNLPETDKEITLGETQCIVSKTDLKGQIPAAPKKTSTAHHAGDEEEWEEF